MLYGSGRSPGQADAAATDAVADKRRIKEEIKAFTEQVRHSFVSVDFDNLIAQHDQMRSSLAVTDIVKSRRLPFTTALDEIKLPYIAKPAVSNRNLLRSREGRSASQSAAHSAANSVCSSNANSAPSTARMLKSKSQLSASMSASGNNSARRTPNMTSRSMMTSAFDPSLVNRSFDSQAVLDQSQLSSGRVEAKLQEVLELMTKAKTNSNPSKLMYRAAEVFDELRMYDRAAYCYNKATVVADAVQIVDTEVMPKDDKYKRKVERMSPTVLPAFLFEQKLLRDGHIYEESERQRTRKMQAHFHLVKLYLLTEVKDLYKAHMNLIEAFQHCKAEHPAEHVQYLYDFHHLIVRYSNAMSGKSDFASHKQVLRSSAGPIADDHLRILLDLVQVDPEDPAVHDWLGMRYAEKCDFPHSQQHFKVARDLREEQQTREGSAAGLLVGYTAENNQLLIAQRSEELFKKIASNVNKALVKQYGTATEYDASVSAAQAAAAKERDYAWFAGRHEDANVTVYLPPPQGWG